MSFLIDSKLFASNMRYFRERQSYTIRELAHRTDLTINAVQALESGTQAPSESQLSRIARALAVKREDLVLPRPPEIEYFEAC
jgi:transcriptional regulator with XRE-family HTH domain